MPHSRHGFRLLLFLPALALAGCGAGGNASDPAVAGPADSAPREVASPPLAPDPDPLAAVTGGGDPTFDTMLSPLHDVEVFARVEGEVVALDVEEGRRVGKGARLAQIDDRERRAMLAESEAAVARAESGWQRAQSLRSESVISEEQFIEAKAQWEIARARRDRARIEWERCAVRAPIRGIVALRRVQIGQTVRASDLLFRISDPDTLRAELLMPESRLGTVRPGQPVRLVPVSGGEAVTARVTRVNPLVDPASGTFRVVIDYDNRGGRLHGGVSVRVALEAAPAERR